MTFRETRRVLLFADLAGYARVSARMDALTVAAFLDNWYRRCADAIRTRGGRVVKYLGDGCFAVFPDEQCVAAVDTATELHRALPGIASRHGIAVGLGAYIHSALVAEGELGPEDDRRYDVLGAGVNEVFLMGSGAGIRLSEPAYRQLPSDRRTEWKKSRSRSRAPYTWTPRR